MSGKVQALLEFHQAHEIEISDECGFSRQEKFTVLQKPNIYYSQLLSFCFYSSEKGTFEINSLGI
jgi:AraC-like DNA-binding protein